MSLRAVFLDVGDTLLYEQPSRSAIYASAARDRGVEVDAGAMLELMRRANRELPREIDGAFRYTDTWFHAFIRKIFHVDLGLREAEVTPIIDELFARFENPRTFRLFPGVPELLAACRENGLVLGVVSNWSARLPRLLAALELDTRFDFVLCSAIEGAEKPERAFFEAALARAGVAAEHALHAGDHPEKDGYGARRAGIEAVLVDHRERLSGEAADAFPRVGGLPELTDLILSRLP